MYRRASTLSSAVHTACTKDAQQGKGKSRQGQGKGQGKANQAKLSQGKSRQVKAREDKEPRQSRQPETGKFCKHVSY